MVCSKKHNKKVINTLLVNRYVKKTQKTPQVLTYGVFCDSEGTRTPNLLGRNQVLYPIKLRNRSASECYTSSNAVQI